MRRSAAPRPASYSRRRAADGAQARPGVGLTGTTAEVACDSSAAVKMRWVAAASSGVAQWKGWRHAVSAVGELVEEGGPHLQDRVGEAELEDRAR